MQNILLKLIFLLFQKQASKPTTTTTTIFCVLLFCSLFELKLPTYPPRYLGTSQNKVNKFSIYVHVWSKGRRFSFALPPPSTMIFLNILFRFIARQQQTKNKETTTKAKANKNWSTDQTGTRTSFNDFPKARTLKGFHHSFIHTLKYDREWKIANLKGALNRKFQKSWQ